MNNQKKIVQLFKNFVQKVFLPNLKKTDTQYFEWNKFNKLISNDNINYESAYQYVQSINSGPNTSQPLFQKRQIPLFKKKKERDESEMQGSEGAFNPSKTFGGERARMMMMKGEADDFGQQKRETGNSGGNQFEDPFRKPVAVSPQSLLPGLEKLCKLFIENQQKFQGTYSGTSKSPIKR